MKIDQNLLYNIWTLKNGFLQFFQNQTFFLEGLDSLEIAHRVLYVGIWLDLPKGKEQIEVYYRK